MNSALGSSYAPTSYGLFDRGPVGAATATRPGLAWPDIALVCLFLIGLYTNYTIYITAKVPFPSAPAGIAGMFLLWRRRDQISPRALIGLICVLAVYLVSIFCATNLGFLSRRTNGLIQLTYSIVIGYALFLTLLQATRRQVAALFLTCALVILIGTLLENYAGLRPISDAVRQAVYKHGVYENDLRDLVLYHRVRPKFFASEPSSVTFCYSLFSFIWLVTSRWRFKLLFYAAMVGVGIFALPGPTLLLMLLLLLPYMLFLSTRVSGKVNYVRLVQAICLAALAVGVFVVLLKLVFPARLNEAAAGNDPSFFYRVRGPAIAAVDVVTHYPFAGAGLTGEPYIEGRVVNLYLRSPAFSGRWEVVSPSTELLINYFWLHWIYLGLVWGVIAMAAVTIWLSSLGVPSVAFCWLVWATLGQASGAYVGPTCWAVLFLAAAAAVLHQRPDPAGSESRVSRAASELRAALANRHSRARPRPRQDLIGQGVALFPSSGRPRRRW